MPSSASSRIASLTPFAIIIIVALIPAPGGLPQHAWYFFSIFAGVIAGLVLEPLPCPAVGLIGATIVAVLAKWRCLVRRNWPNLDSARRMRQSTGRLRALPTAPCGWSLPLSCLRSVTKKQGLAGALLCCSCARWEEKH